MSTQPKCTSTSTLAPMGMASATMGPNSCGLRRSFPQQNVLGGSRCLLQVARGGNQAVWTSLNTSRALRSMFGKHDLPELLVSDNGTAFTCSEFREFLKQNGICQATSAQYHPSSNGLADRAVQTFKTGMKKSASGDEATQLARFLFHYRTTPHSVTGVSPAELLMGRHIHTHLDLLKPDIAGRIRASQARQKTGHDRRSKQRTFAPDDLVFVRNFSGGPTWLPGTVIATHGPLSFEVRLSDNRVVRRHIDHVRSRTVVTGESTDDQDDLDLPNISNDEPADIVPVEDTALLLVSLAIQLVSITLLIGNNWSSLSYRRFC